MKKILLSAAAFAVVAVSAVAVAPTTSEAVPAFARQTGAACNSCHFQSFPQLAPFGRAFKLGAFTDVGEQALVEDDNLSLPAVLNMSVNNRVRFASTKTTAGATSATVKSILMPDENPLFLGGRIGSNTGAFLEWTGNPAGNWQLMNSFDFDSFKAGINLFNAGFGWTSGLEISSVFGQHGGLHGGKNFSAQELNNGGNVQGVALWAANDLVTASLNLITTDTSGNAGALAGINAMSTLMPGIRVIATPEFAGWNITAGLGWANGNKSVASTGTGANDAMVAIDNTFVDFGAQGEVGDTSISFQADWATAKAQTAAEVAAAIGAGTYVDLTGLTPGQKRTGWSARAYVEPVHGFIFSLGYGSDKIKVAASPDEKDTFFHIGASYAVYQNFEIALTYQSAKAKNVGNIATSVLNPDVTVKTTMLQLEAVM